MLTNRPALLNVPMRLLCRFPRDAPSGSIQGVWFTAGFLGLMIIFAIVGLTMTAKRWIRAEQKDDIAVRHQARERRHRISYRHALTTDRQNVVCDHNLFYERFSFHRWTDTTTKITSCQRTVNNSGVLNNSQHPPARF